MWQWHALARDRAPRRVRERAIRTRVFGGHAAHDRRGPVRVHGRRELSVSAVAASAVAAAAVAAAANAAAAAAAALAAAARVARRAERAAAAAASAHAVHW